MHRRAIQALLPFIISLTFAIPCRAETPPNGYPYDSQCLINQHRKACMLASQLVNRFYPPSLINPKYPKNLPSCYAIYDFNKSGMPLTIFAYYTPERGEFLVIRRKADGEYAAAPTAPSAQVIGSRGDIFGQGGGCILNLIPLTKQGKRAIFLMSELGFGNPMLWVFQWNGTKAKNLGPIRHTPTGYVPDWKDASRLYLYPDALAMLSSYDHFNRKIPHFEETHPLYYKIYRLKRGHYVFATYAAYVGWPVSHGTTMLEFINGPRFPAGGTFTLRHNSTGPYILRIGNGHIDSRWRFTSAEIWINGKEVVPPGKINSNTSILTVPLRRVLKRHNTIKIVAHGPAGSQLGLVIEDHTPHLIPQALDSESSQTNGQKHAGPAD